MKGYGFGYALAALEQKMKAKRLAWRGQDKCLQFFTIEVREETIDWIYVVTSETKYIWIPYQADIKAKDWFIISSDGKFNF